jgi:hypothetical protein
MIEGNQSEAMKATLGDHFLKHLGLVDEDEDDMNAPDFNDINSRGPRISEISKRSKVKSSRSQTPSRSPDRKEHSSKKKSRKQQILKK